MKCSGRTKTSTEKRQLADPELEMEHSQLRLLSLRHLFKINIISYAGLLKKRCMLYFLQSRLLFYEWEMMIFNTSKALKFPLN